jgi:hypothetical protein
MPTALIKITQGATTDLPGRAVKGAVGGGVVVFSNGDDTGVVSWTYGLVYVPPGSGISPTTQGPGPTTTYTMPNPDVPGCYRVQLTVVDAAGIEDVDIRNFAAPFPNEELIAPPYQRNPEPLPLTGSAAKPDELNFEGHTHGWDGDDDADHKLMYRALEIVDAVGLSGVLGPATSTLNTIPSWANTSGTLLKNNSQVVIPTNGVIGLGANPSTGGAIRLTNNEGIAWRGSGSFNLQGIVVDSSDNIVIGADDVQLDDVILEVSTGNNVLLRANSVTELTVTDSLVSVANALALGATPATGGTIRLTNDESIAWRGTGAFNLSAIVVDSSDNVVVGGNDGNQDDILLEVPTGQAIYSRINATPELVVSGGKVTVSNALEIGTTVPAAGDMRVESGFILRGRDAADGGDVDSCSDWQDNRSDCGKRRQDGRSVGIYRG